MEEQYQPQTIEANTQKYWQEKHSFQVTENLNKEKFYCLSMFPYPSGSLHMGHVRNYTIGDVIARYQRMLGKNVLQPMGWDAFGLPAENAALKNNIAPGKWTRQNIENIKSQMIKMGFAYDWTREITTCDPSYYQFEQWFFLQLYKKGLVYKKKAEVNWDPVDQTVLANEQVVDGRGWRSGALVERREIPQWFLKITDYADELLNDLNKLDQWPDQVKTMQRNWIGKSTGVDIHFAVDNHKPLTIYTTRPDTLFGISFIALAPKHPLVTQLAKTNPELSEFVQSCQNIKMAEAEMATMEKRGMPLSIDAIHPITHEKIPLWVANFVVMDYGTGALMAVPAHDQRDFEFATKYNLSIKQVIKPSKHQSCDLTKNAFLEEGELIDSGDFTGLTSADACKAIAAYLEKHHLGQTKTNYRLRDWSVSRQRYWGTPIPMILCEHCGDIPVPENDLPVILPEEVEFTGVTSPLKSMPSFYEVTCPACQKPARRETDTFDTFMESSWYYARFTCPDDKKTMLDSRANYWLSVDQYVGGIEHAVLHLLYARFFHKLMRDQGLVNTDEPFLKLLSQGMVLKDGIKMSKSKGNVVDPQLLIDKFGADTVRLFTMFASPPEQSLEWSDSGVEGAHRFLKRVWAFGTQHHSTIRTQNRMPPSNKLGSAHFEKADPAQLDIFKQIYEILDHAKYDYERQQYNTIVSSCMKILNLLAKVEKAQGEHIDIHDIVIHKGFHILLCLLAPITPHITHQLWLDLHYDGIILDAPWPHSSPIVFKQDTIELVVQINGKLRGKISVAHDADKAIIEAAIASDSKLQRIIDNKEIKKLIVVPGKLINIVI